MKTNVLQNCVIQIPKPKPPTKWDIFAKQKGIKKEKRSRMVFDEQSQVKTLFPLHNAKYITCGCCVGVEATMGV